MKFVVLSSSRGTTLQAIVDAIRNGTLQATCAGLITDKPNRGCIETVQTLGLPVQVVERQSDETREAYDHRLQHAIQELAPDCDIVACVGWMRILSPWFVLQWQGRILNVHPSLLPKYPGGHAVADAYNSDDTETGMTIHVIDEGVDTGPIIVQKSCSIKPDDTLETLQGRIQALEKQWYPVVLQQIHSGEIEL